MRLPFEPLSAAIGRVYYEQPLPDDPTWRWDRRSETKWECVVGNPTTVLAELTGVSRRTLCRWVHSGIDENDADRIATVLGYHVCEIWPEWFDQETG